MAQRGLKFGMRIFFLLSGSPSFAVQGAHHVTVLLPAATIFLLLRTPRSRGAQLPAIPFRRAPSYLVFYVVGCFQKALQWWSDGLPLRFNQHVNTEHNITRCLNSLQLIYSSPCSTVAGTDLHHVVCHKPNCAARPSSALSSHPCSKQLLRSSFTDPLLSF